MALIKSTVKLIIREHMARGFLSPALTLGVPEVYATYSELKKWMLDFTGQKIQGTINSGEERLAQTK